MLGNEKTDKKLKITNFDNYALDVSIHSLPWHEWIIRMIVLLILKNLISIS